jgi:hypothetical protein
MAPENKGENMKRFAITALFLSSFAFAGAAAAEGLLNV